MLTQIHIRDLATIAEAQLNLQSGATMITGETGAGKSIFIEAIELTLGGRASANMIRPGKDKAEISLCFDIEKFPSVIQMLNGHDLQADHHECIIRRVITSDGRSRNYVNGSPVPLQFVKELGELLFHLHGQHEQQVLLKADTQRDMLDRFADHLPLASEVKLLADTWKAVTQQISELQTLSAERVKRSEFLLYQLEELRTLQLEQGEWEQLETEHKRLLHSEELMRQLQQVTQLLTHDEQHPALAILNNAQRVLESVIPVEPKAKEWINQLQSAIIQLSELESDLQHYLENTDLDPEKLQDIENRVSQIFNLARKHKTNPQALITLKENLENELSTVNSSDENLLRLQQQQTTLADSYAKSAAILSKQRKQAATQLEKIISNTIRSLSLPHGEFKITFEPETATLSTHGTEKVIFLIKTNPDSSLQPLKVISGGELSRLSLAAHLALAHRTTIPTLVFDEVDTGLSGATAEKIGKLLRQLGHSYQVFCVTHQAQVAACGHQHLLVEKYFIDKATHTRLRLLNKDEQANELARMLGGEKITEKTLAHAKEMLELSPAC